MTTGQGHAAIRRVRALFDVGTMGSMADPQLLERFAGHNREAAELAFAALVERHGPMVLRVCRRELGEDDAHDAFQATFLVLVTRAASLRRRESLASWLHGVALRVARCSRSASARRVSHERLKAANAATAFEVQVDDTGLIVRDEFSRLPDRLRAPIALCDLDDLTHEQAAERLGWPVGTVKSRLSRGRARLRDRLTRRGLTPASAIPLLARMTVLPMNLAEKTARSATELAAGSTSAGTVPASVVSLMQGVRRMMIKESIRNAALAALTFGLLAAGVAYALQDPAVKQAEAIVTKPPASNGPRISYQTRTLLMPGPEWREAVGTRLRKVRDLPNFQVWTVDAKFVPDLIRRAERVTVAPRVSQVEEASASLSEIEKLMYVASIDWINSPDKKAWAALPKVGELKNGYTLTMSGRTLDQGTFIHAGIFDQQVLGIKTYPVPCPGNGTTKFKITGQIQLPDVLQTRFDADWLIPRGEVLLISFGPTHRPSMSVLNGFTVEAGEHFTKDGPPWLAEALESGVEVLDFFGFTSKEARANRAYWESPMTERLIVLDVRSERAEQLGGGKP